MTEQDEQKIDRSIAKKAIQEGSIKTIELTRLLMRDDACSKSITKLIDEYWRLKFVGIVSINDFYSVFLPHLPFSYHVRTMPRYQKWFNVLRTWTGYESLLTRYLEIYTLDNYNKYSQVDVSDVFARPKSFMNCRIKLDEFRDYLNYVERAHKISIPLPGLLFTPPIENLLVKAGKEIARIYPALKRTGLNSDKTDLKATALAVYKDSDFKYIKKRYLENSDSFNLVGGQEPRDFYGMLFQQIAIDHNFGEINHQKLYKLYNQLKKSL